MKQKNFETFLYSTAGVVGMLIALMAFYVVTGAVKQRVDLTADKSYTLSQGTRNILNRLDRPVTIRFYATQGDAMPVALKTFARRVEDLLGEYKQAAHGKIILEKYNPEPDSDAEDSARLNGIQGQMLSFGGDRVYLGLVVSILNEKVAIPWISPDREKLLEYDISRAIARVQNPTPPVVGVMSALPVFGAPQNPMMMMQRNQQSEPWVFISELQKDFTVRAIPMTADKIDDDIKVLVVLHPREITDTAQYAIDQFVLRGGRLLAMVDPHCFVDQMNPQGGVDSASQSTLDKLFKAWGTEMDVTKMVADLDFALREQGGLVPGVLAITGKGINSEDAVASQIDNAVLPFPGAFIGKPAEGLTETVLLNTSTNSQLIDSATPASDSDQIVKTFRSSGTNYALAIRLTGKFKTAFPSGKPEDKNETNTIVEPQIKESTNTGVAVLIADVDMINDRVCVQIQNVLGYRVVQTPNGNLNFIQSLVEQLSGDSDLISLRSRASILRPFTRISDMQASAQQKFQAKIRELQDSLADAQQKLQALQATKQDPQQRLILSPEQEKAVAQYQETEARVKKELKAVQKQLRRDTDQLMFRTKVVNIAAMPALVALGGIILALVKRKRTAAK